MNVVRLVNEGMPSIGLTSAFGKYVPGNQGDETCLVALLYGISYFIGWGFVLFHGNLYLFDCSLEFMLIIEGENFFDYCEVS